MPPAPLQLPLFDAEAPPDAPQGFDYRPDFISPAEEAELAARLASLAFQPFAFRGFLGRRQTVSFGWRYDFSGAGLVRAAPIPDWLHPLRGRAAGLAGVAAMVLTLIGGGMGGGGFGGGWGGGRGGGGLGGGRGGGGFRGGGGGFGGGGASGRW